MWFFKCQVDYYAGALKHLFGLQHNFLEKKLDIDINLNPQQWVIFFFNIFSWLTFINCQEATK